MNFKKNSIYFGVVQVMGSGWEALVWAFYADNYFLKFWLPSYNSLH